MQLEISPEIAIAEFNAGNQWMQQGKLDQAIACYRNALAPQNPELAETYHRLGEALAKQNQFAEAITCYQQAIALHPEFSWVYYHWGEALDWQNQVEPAIAYYQKAIDLDANVSWFHLNLGQALAKQQQIELAIQSYQRAIELDPSYGWSQHFLAEALLKQNQVEEAIAAYQTAVQLEPNAEYIHFRLGKAFQRQNRISETIACYQRAIECSPEFLNPYIELQYLYVPTEQLDSLIQFYQKIAQLYPDLYYVWGNLGDAYTQQEKTEEASRCYQTFCQKETIAAHPELAKTQWKLKKEQPPDFLIAGFPKCGTTSLFSYLCQHPQALCGHRKELNFFTTQFDLGLDWYLSHFPAITDSPEFLTGESTPSYLDYPEVDRRVAQLCPNIKLIVLLRNPIDRAISQYHHLVRLGEESRSLQAVVLDEIEQLQQASEYQFQYVNDWRSCHLSGGLYLYKLQRWFALFPREQFLILQSEMLYRDSAATTKRACQFLGLPDYDFSDFPVLQAGDYAPVSEDVRSILRDYFQPHNQKLEDFLEMQFNWN
jgi:tetratricopeptide (TPR) repeat protein